MITLTGKKVSEGIAIGNLSFYKRDSKENRRIYVKAVSYTHLLHDGRGAAGAPGRTIEALRDALPQLLREGYEFKRLDQYE